MDLEHSTNSFYRASNAIPGPHFVNKRIFLQMTAKLSSKVPRNLPDVVINRPRNKKEATPVARPPGGVSRAILYFRGLGRQAIRHLRLFFDKLRIPKEAIQFVSFIGENVAEVILWNHFREDVVTRLATAKVQLDPTFDPLSSRSFTNASTIERLGLATKSEGGKVQGREESLCLPPGLHVADNIWAPTWPQILPEVLEKGRQSWCPH